MTTVAEDLLNDFDDSGDENEGEQTIEEDGYDGQLQFGKETSMFEGASNGNMELEGDEEEYDGADTDVAPAHLKMEDQEDEEETKARVEKMQLASVSDVRSVAGLMKQLDPVIEVSTPSPIHPIDCRCS
jgi:U4/U6 small nuclear ribonucleoprotein PRP31